MTIRLATLGIDIETPKVKHIGMASVAIEDYTTQHGKNPDNTVVLGIFLEILSNGRITAEQFLECELGVFGEVNRALSSFLAQLN